MLFRKTKAATLRTTLLLLPLAASLTACSTFSTRATEPTPEASAIDKSERAAIKETPNTKNDITDSGSDLEGVPLAVNRAVFQWIDYFQGQGRPHMERYLQRSTRYMPIMQGILQKEGLPKDLIYIALIESGFSSTAHSSASAVGYWQFIRATGKHYGMQIDNFVDERRDFVRSTQAAADYFKGLYNLFGSWYLAIASYNVGENRVKNLVMKHHTRDFWQLARENKLPEETANYVPKFLAARLIAREPEKYGFVNLEYMPPLEFNEVEFNSSIDLRKLAKEMNLEYDDLRDLNPMWKKGVALDKAGKLTLRVPKGTEAQALAAAPSAIAESRKRYVADEDYSYYRVRRGDNIATIARKFNTTQGQIRELNNMSRRAMLVAGKRIRVPGETVAGLSSRDVKKKPTDSQVESSSKRSTPSLASTVNMKPARSMNRKVHVVRRGENLMQIANRYKVPLRELASVNRLRNKSRLAVGSRLEIP